MQKARFPYDVAALNNLYGGDPVFSAIHMTPPAHESCQATGLSTQQQQRLSQLLADLQGLSDELAGDPEALLMLLRQLEQLHRSLQDGAFRSSLPADRTALFNLLRAMEQSGGWPYIPRLQLRTFMDLLQRDRDETDHPLAA